MNIIQKIFGTHSQNELKRVYPIADAVMALDEDMWTWNEALPCTDRRLYYPASGTYRRDEDW